MSDLTMPIHPPSLGADEAIAALGRGAEERDRTGEGLGHALDILSSAGLLGWNATAGRSRPPAAGELALVREVARADASVGRVFDGHLNGVERLAVQAPEDLVSAELDAVRHGQLRVGVWGGDPRPAEGEPARIRRRGPGEVLTGVKTFCSGAGSLDRALVLAREDGPGAPILVWIDLRDAASVQIDEAWYRTAGLRASASHRVVFHDAPVLARFGGPGGISAQPWIARDALRTAASWAGMADAATDAALADLAARDSSSELDQLAAGRMLAAQGAVDAWLTSAALEMDAGASERLSRIALHARVGIAQSARTILAEAASACGSHPFATRGPLDRARRDLELFLLQHRLDRGLARAGAEALQERRGVGR